MRLLLEYTYGAHLGDWLFLIGMCLGVWALIRWEKRTRGGIN